MVMVPLTSGAYSSQSQIANAQRCRNLYVEKNPPETRPIMPFTHYPRPGLTLLSSPPGQNFGRCLYPANNGDVYAVVGQQVFYIDPNYNFNLIGQLFTPAMTPVYMADNGAEAIIVDGSIQGYSITFANNRQFQEIDDQNFLGAIRADFIDSFLVMNKPNSNEWYSTLSDQVAFDSLFVGIKTAWPDNIISIVTCERAVWLFGPKKSEVWYNAGSVPFPFQIYPGNIIEQGCAAQYSPAKMDTNVYWLSESPEGDRMAMRGNSQFVAQRISTHAIEYEWRSYPTVADAIGDVYQISGHSFYRLHCPTADKTWVHDEATGQWWEDNSIDSNGNFHCARNRFSCFSYGVNLSLDWQTGQLYKIDPLNTTDNGTSIIWTRGFPHIMNELKYLSYSAFVVDCATGSSVNTSESSYITDPWSSGYSSGFGPLGVSSVPYLAMRMSRNGGVSFGNNRIKGLVSSGNYRTMQRFRQNGIARDAVFELSSTAANVSALNGAYVDLLPGTS
jgi:hypothetical protein